VVAKWTGELDHKQLTSVLNRDSWIEAQEPEAILDQKQEKMR
jgi:aerobic C4-dicarboxylate transport protein